MQRPLRLRDRADFKRLRGSGRALRHPLLLLSLAPNALAHNRYGFIVARHVGGAVARNQVRRRLREAVRLAHPRLAQGYDLVWIARNEIADQSYNQINRAVFDLLGRARLWKPEPEK